MTTQIKAYKFRLYPNKKQTELINKTIGCARFVFNYTLAEQKKIDDMWLNNVVTYEIIPLLNEYWFDESSKVREWEFKLREAIR